MAVRIEIGSKINDTRAAVRKKSLSDLSFGNKIKDLVIVDVHTVDKKFSKDDLKKIANALSSSVSQKIGERVCPEKFSWAVEVGFLPGVNDNLANSARKIVEDLLKIRFGNDEGWYTSQITFVEGKLSKKEIDELAHRLYNPLIQRVIVKSFSNYQKDGGMGLVIPKVNLLDKFKVLEIDLEKSDDELIKLGKEGIVDEKGISRGPLALDLTYLKSIRDYFREEKR